MKILKIYAISYAVKTILFAIAWLFIPDLPQRTTVAMKQAWEWVAPVPQEIAAPAAAPAALVVPITTSTGR
jgi:hypothetical protein